MVEVRNVVLNEKKILSQFASKRIATRRPKLCLSQDKLKSDVWMVS